MQFVDANVLLYAISRDPGETGKAGRANELLSDGHLGLSTQVLQEFYVQATRATRADRLTHRQATDLAMAFARFPVQEISVPVVLAALATRDRYGLSYWDAAIIEAGRLLGCDQVLSEDLRHGQDYGGITVIDPFR